jgi:hypothetical protein
MLERSPGSPRGRAPAVGTPIPAAGLPEPDTQRLGSAAILLAGAGNIGSHLALFAARAGVGLLRIVDRDVVEERNCRNQGFEREDVGRPKAEFLAERLHRQFPGQRFEARAADLEDLPLGDFQVDVLLGSLDSRRARQVLVSEIAWPLGVPVVDGGVGEGLVGRVQVFLPRPGQACLECTWGQEDYRRLTAEYPCVPGGQAAAPPTAAPAFGGAVVAGVMMAECLRLLGRPAPAESHEIAFDLAHRRFLVSWLRRAAGCRFDHEVVGEAHRLSASYPTATVGDLLAAVASRFGPEPVHLEFRRGLASEQGAHRFVSPAELAPRAAASLASLGLLPGDRIRARSGTHSVFFLLAETNPG